MRKILATTMALAAFVLALCGGCGTPGGMTSDTASDTTNSTTSESESEDMAKKYPNNSRLQDLVNKLLELGE